MESEGKKACRQWAAPRAKGQACTNGKANSAGQPLKAKAESQDIIRGTHSDESQ